MTHDSACNGYFRARLAATVLATSTCAYLSLATTDCGSREIVGPETTLRVHFERGQDRIVLRAVLEGPQVFLQFDSGLGVAALGAAPVSSGIDAASRNQFPSEPSVENGRAGVWLVCDGQAYETADGDVASGVLQAGPECELELVRDEVDEAWDTELTVTPVQSVDCSGEAHNFGIRIEQLDSP